jgi:VIT1/CCC1 family predicted Fe2+/Mn2+ transporter
MIPNPESDADAVHPSRWPKLLRRGPMETLATVLIAVGVLMMLQPFALTLYTYSFITTLVGVVMFTFVTKFPE